MRRSEIPTTERPRAGGRSFYCPVCEHSHRPPANPELRMEGRVCCEVCAAVMRNEGARAPLEKPAGQDAARRGDARAATRPFSLPPFWP